MARHWKVHEHGGLANSSEKINANITEYRGLKISYSNFSNCKILQLKCGGNYYY